MIQQVAAQVGNAACRELYIDLVIFIEYCHGIKHESFTVHCLPAHLVQIHFSVFYFFDPQLYRDSLG